MDSKQLENNLSHFFHACTQKGYPIEQYCIIENTTDFTLEVKSNWIDKMDSCSQVLDILLPILWEQTDIETRKHLFAISVLDFNEQPNCFEELTVKNAN
ncbi:hypothetical protein [Flavobacterium branchiophilum]|uniref:Uncharacterized protein n=1 Tax=Flavobacterium branchiophilum TaxID=55197 RepID=A0A2H3KQD6_9FLAO|nr:hypothetical protein [Flavobacterium branchiophilum]PDS23792.1 hypothetical protein B0A77_09830 [Flavobacterium branchiophilum]